MSVYTPTPLSHPTFTFPGNGGTENAALFVGLPQLADEIAFVAAGGYMVPQNWEPGGATTHALKRLAFCERDVRWYGVSSGGLDSLEASSSYGRTWTDLAGSLGASNTLLDVAVASAGTAPGDVVASLAVIVQGLAVVGCLAAVTTKGRIIVSTDSGATWRYAAAIDGTASAFYMRGAGGGLLAVNSTDSTSVFSSRSGKEIGQSV